MGKQPSTQPEWTSNAEWPRQVYRGIDGSGITTDTHSSEYAAQCVCEALEREGFGGEGKHFPIRTWVSRIPSTQPKDAA